MTSGPSSVLILSMAPYRFSTRTRKAAKSYRASGLRVSFTSLAGVGRTGKWDQAGRWEIDGIEVRQIALAQVQTAPSKLGLVRNLARSYLPGFLRLTKEILCTRTDIIHVTGVPLSLLGVIHKIRFGSRLLLDVNERPASVTSSGSVFGLATRLEPLLLTLSSHWADVTTTVAPGHAEMLAQKYAFREVLVVRNGPANWERNYVPPPPRAPQDILRIVTIGTIFEGRAFEMMIQAAAKAIQQGAHIRLDIYGSGRSAYIESLHRRIEDLCVTDQVTIHPPVASEDVPQTYERGHLGLALYETGNAGNDSLSNKIIEVVCSGRPVLAGRLPENERFINEFRVGWLTQVNAEQIAQKFVALASVRDFRRISQHCFNVGNTRLRWDSDFSHVIERLTANYSTRG